MEEKWHHWRVTAVQNGIRFHLHRWWSLNATIKARTLYEQFRHHSGRLKLYGAPCCCIFFIHELHNINGMHFSFTLYHSISCASDRLKPRLRWNHPRVVCSFLYFWSNSSPSSFCIFHFSRSFYFGNVLSGNLLAIRHYCYTTFRVDAIHEWTIN